MSETTKLSSVWVVVAVGVHGDEIAAIFASQRLAENYILSAELPRGILQLVLREHLLLHA